MLEETCAPGSGEASFVQDGTNQFAVRDNGFQGTRTLGLSGRITMMNDGMRAALRTDVGAKIREWRLRRELSQADVARRAGITQASLSNYENGKRDMPLSTLMGVTAALNVSLGDLLELPDVIVVRDSLLGRAVEQLRDRMPTGPLAEAAL
jgi:transcriptional regulator with XRE-family HTH domain